MKKLTIIFKDKSKVIYTMKNSIDYKQYLARHSVLNAESVVLQQYPKKDNEPLILV